MIQYLNPINNYYRQTLQQASFGLMNKNEEDMTPKSKNSV